MALLIPRILYIIYLAQNGLQQSLWMILHIIALVLVWGGGIVNRSSKS
jgi:hypothetical protein